jgi:hypothetical protein
MEEKLGVVPGDNLFEIVLLLSMQDLHKLATKCDTISLLLGVKSVWHPSTMKLLKSQAFVQNSRTRLQHNPKVSRKKPA